MIERKIEIENDKNDEKEFVLKLDFYFHFSRPIFDPLSFGLSFHLR